MLVLTRKLNEVISIGGLLEGKTPIEVTVIEIRGDQVRLGITAPGNVQVHRKEIWLEIKEQGSTRPVRPLA